MQRVSDVYLDGFGRPVVGATVTVYNAGTSTLASIYQASGDPLSPGATANPFATDGSGAWAFAAPNGRYDIVVSSSISATRSYPNIYLSDAGGPFLANPMTTQGDMIGGGLAGAVTRVPGNATATVMYMSEANGAIPGFKQVAASEISGLAAFIAANGVSSFNGRIGAVVPVSNDYSFAQLSGSVAATQLPAFTGDVTTSAGSTVTTLAATQTGAHTWNALQTFSNNNFISYFDASSLGRRVLGVSSANDFYAGPVDAGWGATTNQTYLSSNGMVTVRTNGASGSFNNIGLFDANGFTSSLSTSHIQVRAAATGNVADNVPVLSAYRSGVADSIMVTTSTGGLKLLASAPAIYTDANINAYAGMVLNSSGAGIFSSSVTATNFIGPGTGLTGTAASLTAGISNALASATTTVSVSGATAPTAGQVLTATSGTAASWQTLASGGAHVQSQTFTASGTFTPPTGVNFVDVIVQGGGGGGAGGNTSSLNAGGGGGGAGTTIRRRVAVTPGVGITVTIGAAGGAGAVNTNGTAGGDSSFGSLVLAKGGQPGSAGGTSAGGVGGASGGPDTTWASGIIPASAAAGGANSNSYALSGAFEASMESGGSGGTGASAATANNVAGGNCDGWSGGTITSTATNGGGGGASSFGIGGTGGNLAAGGASAANTGAGGGGGAASFAGGAGSAGKIIVNWVN